MNLLFLAALAHATPTFPGDVADHLGMSCTPTCLLCHDNPGGGSGTATQPFAAAMLENGLIVGTDSTVGPALDAVQAGGTDYDEDGDGLNDVDELVVGANPNPDGTDFCSVTGPDPVVRGCFGSSGSTALGAGFLAWAWSMRRSRRA